MDDIVEEKEERISKILIVGDIGSGKTAIIKRYTKNEFSQHYRSTVGVDFGLKRLYWSNSRQELFKPTARINSEGLSSSIMEINENNIIAPRNKYPVEIQLQIWDIAGQERFGSMLRIYYKQAVGAIIVFDLTRPSTFENVTIWKKDIDDKVPNIPILLVGNKCDLVKERNVPNIDEIKKYASNNKFIGYYETSAKEDINLNFAFETLVENVCKNKKEKKEDNDAINLENTNETKTEKKCAC